MSSIGIIGAGELTRQYYLPAIRDSHLFNRILISDIIPEHVEECALHFTCNTASTEDLIRSCPAIIIATPPHTHSDLLQQCMYESKHVLCEKPVLLSSHELNSLLKKSNETACHIYGAHIRRLFPAIAAAKNYLHTTNTGALIKVEIFEGGRYTYSSRTGYQLTSTMGGVWTDTGSHALDCAFYLCGLKDNGTAPVFGTMIRDRAEPAHEIESSFTLGATSFFVKLSRYTPLSNKINLHFEYCTLEVPLFLHPYFTVWKEKQKYVHPCPYVPAYLPQAFRMQLEEIFVKQNCDLFGLEQFSLVTRVLEAGLAQP